MIANHKRLASDLVQKHDQSILMLRKKAGRGRIEDECYGIGRDPGPWGGYYAEIG